MSLLLEALKKAERDKKEAERRSMGGAAPSAPPSASPSARPSAPPSVPPSASPSARPSAPPSASPSARPLRSEVPPSVPQEENSPLEMLEPDGGMLTLGERAPVTKDQVPLSFNELSLELVEVDASPVEPVAESARKDIVRLNGAGAGGGFPSLTLGMPGEDLAPESVGEPVLEAPSAELGFPSLIDGVESGEASPALEAPVPDGLSLPSLDLDHVEGQTSSTREAPTAFPTITDAPLPSLEDEDDEAERTVMSVSAPKGTLAAVSVGDEDEGEERTVMSVSAPKESTPSLSMEDDEGEAERTVMSISAPMGATPSVSVGDEEEGEERTVMSVSPPVGAAGGEERTVMSAPVAKTAPPRSVPTGSVVHGEETVVTSKSPPSDKGEATVMSALRSTAAKVADKTSTHAKGELASLLNKGRRGGSPQPFSDAPPTAKVKDETAASAPGMAGSSDLNETWQTWDHLKETGDFKLNLLVDEEPAPKPVSAPVPTPTATVKASGSSPVTLAAPMAPPPTAGTPQQAGQVLMAAATGVAKKLKERKRIMILGALAATIVLSMGGAWIYFAVGPQGVQQMAVSASSPPKHAKLIQPVDEPPPPAPQDGGAAVTVGAGTPPAEPVAQPQGTVDPPPTVASTAPAVVSTAPTVASTAPTVASTTANVASPTMDVAQAIPAPPTPAVPTDTRPMAATPVPSPAAEAVDRGQDEVAQGEQSKLRRQRDAEDVRLARLQEAFEAVRTDKPERAKEVYNRVLQEEKFNRDAMLGMAAAALQEKNSEEAEYWYGKLLERDPNDSLAWVGSMGLRGVMDPVAMESQIKNLLRVEPDAPHLLFQLGRVYASQNRWSEAQQAFFQALTGDGENPDYAFNLAVSLEHLGQRLPAAEYYHQALVRAARQPASFDLALAHKRVESLRQGGKTP